MWLVYLVDADLWLLNSRYIVCKVYVCIRNILRHVSDFRCSRKNYDALVEMLNSIKGTSRVAATVVATTEGTK